MVNKVFAGECIKGIGPFGKICEGLENESGGEGALTVLASIFTRVIGVVTLSAGLYFLIQFFTASFTWMSSGGDPAKLGEARQRIINALIGLVLVVGAVAIMGVVETFFGIKFLDLPGLAGKIAP